MKVEKLRWLEFIIWFFDLGKVRNDWVYSSFYNEIFE